MARARAGRAGEPAAGGLHGRPRLSPARAGDGRPLSFRRRARPARERRQYRPGPLVARLRRSGADAHRRARAGAEPRPRGCPGARDPGARGGGAGRDRLAAARQPGRQRHRAAPVAGEPVRHRGEPVPRLQAQHHGRADRCGRELGARSGGRPASPGRGAARRGRRGRSLAHGHARLGGGRGRRRLLPAAQRAGRDRAAAASRSIPTRPMCA